MRDALARHSVPERVFTPHALSVLRTWSVDTLGDVLRLLPEEILSLPDTSVATLRNLDVHRLWITSKLPRAAFLSASDLAEFDGVDLREIALSAPSLASLAAAKITTLGDLARTSPVALNALGLSPHEQHSCLSALYGPILDSAPSRPSQDDPRPLPPNFETKPFAYDDLGLCWIGPKLSAEGLKTYGDVMRFLDDPHRADRSWLEAEARRGIEHLVANAADSARNTEFRGEILYRTPYRTDLVPVMTTWHDWYVERAKLNRLRWNARDPLPDWAKTLYRHGLDNLVMVGEADIAFLWEIVDGDVAQIAAMIVGLRRALMEAKDPGSSVAVYGPTEPVLIAEAAKEQLASKRRPGPRARLASSDVDTPPLLWATRMAAEAIRHARSTEDEALIDFDRLDGREQTALFREAEAAIHATFDTIADWDDAKIARFVRTHRR